MVVWDLFHQQYDGYETSENVVALIQCTWKIQNIVHFADIMEWSWRTEVDISTPGPHYHKKPSVHRPSSEAFHRTAPGNRTKSPFQMRTAKKASKRNGNNSSTTTIRTATTKKTKVSILSQRRQPNCACKCLVCEATRASTTASWNFLHVSFRQLLAISLLSTCRVNWLPSGLRQFNGKGLRFGELVGLPYIGWW